MKRNKSKSKPNYTEGGQTIVNNGSVGHQVIAQNLHGNIVFEKQAAQNPPKSREFSDWDLIKKAISQAETNEAITLLKSWLESNKKDKMDILVLIEGRWNQLRTDKIKGVLESENFNLEQNRIHDALLGLISELEHSTQNK